jgi:RNA polymerase subunit RPABC4/transcription elongation factor Spt4
MPATLYCIPCRQLIPEGSTMCPLCYGSKLACLQCHQTVPDGRAICPGCTISGIAVRPAGVREALATIPSAVAQVARVPEIYQAGQFGVTAEVIRPARDVAIMNELLQLVQLLHGMAGRLNQFVGMTDHTRALIKAMRTLANEAQEEVELRGGVVR